MGERIIAGSKGLADTCTQASVKRKPVSADTGVGEATTEANGADDDSAEKDILPNMRAGACHNERDLERAMLQFVQQGGSDVWQRKLLAVPAPAPQGQS